MNPCQKGGCFTRHVCQGRCGNMWRVTGLVETVHLLKRKGKATYKYNSPPTLAEQGALTPF